MVFNSLAFALFFIAITLANRVPVSWTARKVLLTLFSYAFYAAWYPSTIVLLWASTLLDFFVTHGMARARSQGSRRMLLVASLCLNLGLLGFYKYGAFLASGMNTAFFKLGVAASLPLPDVVLPVGISFYTFMSLAFVIDVYRGHARPPRSFLDFALFLTFYPHLVAGPIVRSQDFLPQCLTPRSVNGGAFSWGLSLIAFGLFEKTVLADALLAPIVDRVFAARSLAGMDAWLGALAFSGQIFCDFAGYSTCAVGAAACLGFMLPRNFRNPYAAAGLTDFWRRWHVSLSSWLRDYLYISLGGNRVSWPRQLINLMITMLLGGLWHGASWMFVVWGALHGFYLWFERLLRLLLARLPLGNSAPLRAFAVGSTFLAVTIAWVPFRAPDTDTARRVLGGLAGLHGFGHVLVNKLDVAVVCLTLGGILAVQNLCRDLSLEDVVNRVPAALVTGGLSAIFVLIAIMAGEDRSFIYFQF